MCLPTKTEPQTPFKGKKAPRGALRRWGDEEEEGGGALLELVALRAT